MNTVAIKLERITKIYTIHHEKPTLVEKFVKGDKEQFTALDNINLTIMKGEKIGLIGPNGSGKTTLLKIITGITTPTSGTVSTKGKIVSLIDIEAGFHPDLTGYQNIFLNGMVIGMTKEEIDKKINAIIDYADIKQFIDIPMYTYSDGMMLRLGFSIAIQSNPDIIILDESFVVGDDNFRKKSKETINNYLLNKKCTVIIATHWLEFLQHTCNKIIQLSKGTIIRSGNTNILKAYTKNNGI